MKAWTANSIFFKMIGTCRRHNIHVIGVRAANDDQRRLARGGASLALLPGGSLKERPAPEAPPAEAEPETATAPEPANEPAPAKIVNQPVRSGQQVYAPEGDLIILAPVQAGAEVLAAGNIHVYGPLRGRALAGIHGAESAGCSASHLRRSLCPSPDTIKSPKIFRTLAGKALCRSSSGTMCWW